MFKNIVSKINNFSLTKIIRPTSTLFEIPIDKNKQEELLYSLNVQKTISGFAWIFYPGITLITGLPAYTFAPFCSTVHCLASKNIVRQLGYHYYTEKYVGKKYWVNLKDVLVIAEPSWKNFWWETYGLHTVYTHNNANTLNYIDMNTEQRKFVRNISQKRQNRFRTMIGGIIVGAVSFGSNYGYNYSLSSIYSDHEFSYCYDSIASEIAGGIGIYIAIIAIINATSKHYKLLIPKITSDKLYFYVDINSNIRLTDSKYGHRKMFPVIRA